MELLDISTVKSKNLPIVFVEDIPVEALIPNLVQLYQKTGAVEFFRRRHSSEGVDAKFSSTLPKDWCCEIFRRRLSSEFGEFIR